MALALLAAAGLLLVIVIARRGRPLRYVFLALLLMALALGVWYTVVRTPPDLP